MTNTAELQARLRIADARGLAPPQNWTTVCADALAAQDAELAALRAERDAAVADAERWRWLRELRCNSLSLTRNDDHACNYMTAKQWIEETGRAEDWEDVPAEELQRMKDTNTIWRLQVYPDTPIGFNVWHGATPEAAVDAARTQPEKKP